MCGFHEWLQSDRRNENDQWRDVASTFFPVLSFGSSTAKTRCLLHCARNLVPLSRFSLAHIISKRTRLSNIPSRSKVIIVAKHINYMTSYPVWVFFLCLDLNARMKTSLWGLRSCACKSNVIKLCTLSSSTGVSFLIAVCIWPGKKKYM